MLKRLIIVSITIGPLQKYPSCISYGRCASLGFTVKHRDVIRNKATILPHTYVRLKNTHEEQSRLAIKIHWCDHINYKFVEILQHPIFRKSCRTILDSRNSCGLHKISAKRDIVWARQATRNKQDCCDCPIVLLSFHVAGKLFGKGIYHSSNGAESQHTTETIDSHQGTGNRQEQKACDAYTPERALSQQSPSPASQRPPRPLQPPQPPPRLH